MLRSRPVLWLSVFIFPPFALVLLWMRGDLGVLRRIAGTLAICVVAIVELFYVYGMHILWDGNVKPYGVSFASRSRHDALVEATRARQRVERPPQQAALVETAKSLPPAAAPSLSAPASSKPAMTVREKPEPAGYWTDFRGPNRAGVYAETAIETAWPATGLPRLWKQPIGAGYASFTVAEGRAYTIEQRRDREAVTAYDVRTGRELWAFTYPALFEEVLGGPGPRATPVYHEGLIYSVGANGDFYCLSAETGKPKWSKNILADNGAKNMRWAMSGSPLIVDEKVIVTPGGADGKSIVAYNRLSGESLWHSLNDRAGYTSPILATLAGRTQIVWISAERAVGLAVEDGKQLWAFPFPAQMDMNCSQPVVVDETHVLLSSAPGPGAAMLEIAKTGDGYAARPVWQNNRMKNKFNSSVLYQGYIYGLDEAILACIDAKTGELKWKGGRYGYGQLLLAGSHLIVLTEQGDVVLVRATPEGHQELARFSAIEGRTWNIPAIDNGLLLVRNSTEMACFRLGKMAQ
ncbi:MAG TPA: PQQ-binding-like beta-propeller repeat protein [Bryobacteraceae bacterium]|nr:PQQ-binding-like beta-propeller repeat protein [Bryobacteraceae bacterium]